MAQFSHSKLSTFEQCPLKYKFRYIDKIIPEVEKTIEAHLGTVVHSTLEWLYAVVKDERRVPTLDEVIVYYTEKWKEEFKPEFVIVKANEGMTSRHYFEKGINFILNYYIKHQPFEDETVALEKRIYLKVSEGKHGIIGFIDRLVHNKEKNIFEIHDYKTANFLPSQEKMDEDRQLALYSIAVKEEFGQDKDVKLIWHFLAHNTVIESQRTLNQLQNLKRQIEDLIKKIESTTEFAPCKSALCDWCEYKSICPAWGNSSEDKENFKSDKYPTLMKYMKK